MKNLENYHYFVKVSDQKQKDVLFRAIRLMKKFVSM